MCRLSVTSPMFLCAVHVSLPVWLPAGVCCRYSPRYYHSLAVIEPSTYAPIKLRNSWLPYSALLSGSFHRDPLMWPLRRAISNSLCNFFGGFLFWLFSSFCSCPDWEGHSDGPRDRGRDRRDRGGGRQGLNAAGRVPLVHPLHGPSPVVGRQAAGQTGWQPGSALCLSPRFHISFSSSLKAFLRISLSTFPGSFLGTFLRTFLLSLWEPVWAVSCRA